MTRVTRKQIEEEDRRMLSRQAQLRLAADAVTAVLAELPEVATVALIGHGRCGARCRASRRSAHSEFRSGMSARTSTWRCGSIVSTASRLSRERSLALQRLLKERNVGVAHHQVEIFVMQSRANDHLGRLCTYGQCPKGKRECAAPGCGREPFLQQHAEFRFWPPALAEDRIMRLYERGCGILLLAADTPAEGRETQEAV